MLAMCSEPASRPRNYGGSPWLSRPTFMLTCPKVPIQTKSGHVIPSDCPWDGNWELAGDLVVEVQTCQEEVLAIAHQLTVEEYGAGASLEEAVRDLLTSLLDYRESLEERD